MQQKAPEREFPPLERVRRDLRVRWYRCPIEPARLRELMRRSDLQGAFQTLGHLGLWAACGAATAWFFVHGMWLPFAIALWCQGTVGTFMRGLGTHELGHGTVFKTKWLNRFFLVPMSMLTWWSYHEYAMSHTYHHRYTLYPEGDREVVLPIDLPLKPLQILQRLTVNVQGMLLTIGATVRMAIPLYRRDLTGIRTSEWTEALFKVAPEVERKAVRFARLTILFHAGLLVVSALTGAWWVSIVFTGFLFCGNWLAGLVGTPMHVGLMDGVPDFRMSVRSNRLDPFTSFLYWRMNWHTEHHMFAGVPCYNLKKLAREIAPDMPELRGLWQSWREMIETEKRRRTDPTFQYQTPLPPTAHPAVLSEEDVPSRKGERARMESSIGELAPVGQ